MKIYTKEKRFNARTGKQELDVISVNHLRCDFTGEKVDVGDAPTIHIDYHHIDPCFGSGDIEYDFGKKYKIDMFHFLSQPYDFADWGVYTKLASLLQKKKNTLDITLRDIRIATAEKLIKAGTVEPWQINGEDDE